MNTVNSRNMKITLTDNYLMTKHNNFPKNCIKKLMNSSLIHSENPFPQECSHTANCYFPANIFGQISINAGGKESEELEP